MTAANPPIFPPRVPATLLSIAIAYFLGSVPFGLLLGRIKGLDIREHGSRNIGATNVWRVCGWKFGLSVFILDAIKGAASVLSARWISGYWEISQDWPTIAAAMAAILGHSFPIWLKFKGGKGVATSLGAVLTMMWLPSLLAFGVWIILFAGSRYVSLASILAAFVFPIIAWMCGFHGPILGFSIIAATLVILRHKANIQRLCTGTESRFQKKKT